MAETTFHIRAQDGIKLAGSAWVPRRPKMVVAWVHGFAEHRKRYAHFAGWLNERRVALVAIDVRGHGDSEGKRGYVKYFSDYFWDVSALLHFVRENFEGIPVSLGCHSHGGLIVSRYLEENPPPLDLKCVLFSAPFLGLPPDFPGWKRKLGDMVTSILPKLSIPTGIDSTFISHDPKIQQLYAGDPTIFKTATVRWFHEVLNAHVQALSRAPRIQIPALVMQGMGDRIVSVDASRRFYEDLGSREKLWIPYRGLYHEILNETSRLEVYEDFYRFLKKHGKKKFLTFFRR